MSKIPDESTSHMLRVRVASILFDIDVIINRTLVYGALTGTLALVYQGTLVSLQTLFVTFTGQDTFVANVISTVVTGALFEPLR